MNKLKGMLKTISEWKDGKGWRQTVLAVLFMAAGTALAHADGYTPEQYYAAGYNSYQAQQYSQAITYLNAAIQLNPAYEAAYQLAGNCFYALGDKNDALVYYMKASTLQPGNAQLAQLILSIQAQMGNAQVNTQMNVTTTTQTTTTGDTATVAPAADSVDPDEDDSRQYDQAKSRMIKISGPQHKAYLYDTTENHTLSHVLLCANVTNVQFLNDAVGKAWRIILTQQDGTKMTYDQDGNFMLKSQN